MAKVPKKIRIFIITIAIISLSIFILPILLLSVPYVQTHTLSYIVERFEEKADINIKIGGVNLYYYDFLKLYDVEITSKEGKVILDADRIESSISIPFLLRKRINLNTIKVVNGNFYLNKENKNSDYNIKHILDAFKSKKKKSILPWSLDFESIILYHCRFHYDIFSSPQNNKFNKDHLYFKDLSAKLSYYQSINRKRVVHLEKLSAHEKYGLDIKNFHFDFTYYNGDILTNSIELFINNSSLSINEFNINVSDTTDYPIYSQSIIKTRLIPRDFTFLKKDLQKYVNPVNFDLDLSGSLNSLNIANIDLNVDSIVSASGYFIIDNIINNHNLYPQVNGELKYLKVYNKGFNILDTICNNKSKNKIDFSRLELIDLSGNIKSNQKNVFFDFDLNSNIGSIKDTCIINLGKDGVTNIETHIITDSLCFEHIYNNSTIPSNLNINLHINSSLDKNKKIKGLIEGKINKFTFKKYDYSNISINGLFDNTSFNGNVSINDKNLDLIYNGDINFNKSNLNFDFNLNVNKANLYNLNLTNKKIDNLKFNIISNIKGKYPEILNGDFVIKNFSIVNNNSLLKLNDFKIHTHNSLKEDSIEINSDLVEGYIRGNYNLSILYKEINNYVSSFASSLISKKDITEKIEKDFLNLNLKIKPNKEFYNLFSTQYSFNSEINIKGYYDKKDLNFSVLTDNLKKGKGVYKNLSFTAKNVKDKFIINAYLTSLSSKRDPKKLTTSIITSNNNSKINIAISNNDNTISNTLNFNSNLLYSKDSQNIKSLLLQVHNSDLYLKDSLWNISPCNISFTKDLLNIDNFKIYHNKHFIDFNGTASNNDLDTLKVNFNKFDLQYVMNLIPNFKLQFGGIIIGHIEAPHLFRDFSAFGKLSAKKFSINDVHLGDLNFKTTWNNKNSSININGNIIKKDDNLKTDSCAIVSGMYIPSKDSLDINVQAEKIDLSFLKCYLDKTLHNIKALGTGSVKVIGNTKKKTIGIYSDAYLENASFDIEQLQSTFYFSDSIHLTPYKIKFENITVKDMFGNKGFVNGDINHHYFKDMKLDIKIDAQNILALNIPQNIKDYYYGKAFCTGSVFIHGLQDDIIIDVNAKTEKHTDMTFVLNDVEDSNNYQFIKFKNNDVSKKNKYYLSEQRENTFGINKNFTLNLQIDVTPDAALTLITDPLTGDKINARGTGAIKMTYDNKNNMQLFGNYIVEKGNYYFVYENLLKRTFKIEPGGRISFSGDPMNAKLDLKANYSVNADLENLISEDELSGLNLSTNDVLVNCLLALNGNLKNLNIKLGLTFPSADAELKRKILNIINNDEILNQQIVFLLIFGNFSSANSSSSSSYSETTYVTNMVSSTVASTVASTFNSMLRNVFGYSNISLDLDYKTNTSSADIGNAKEWTVGMSGNWLDDRLSIKGNLGQRENLAESGTTQFIGEFDLRLKLKNSDHWSWKVFNKANDNLYFKSALNTQGAGIVYNNSYKKSFFQKVKTFFVNLF